MQTITYECNEYASRLYISNNDVLLLDIFVKNPEKNRIKIISKLDNVLQYKHYKTQTNYYNDCNGGYSQDVDINKYNMTIKLNDIYPILENYNIYNAECENYINSCTILVTLFKKDFFAYNQVMDENKMNIKWSI
jgi:hypothetical protein